MNSMFDFDRLHKLNSRLPSKFYIFISFFFMLQNFSIFFIFFFCILFYSFFFGYLNVLFSLSFSFISNYMPLSNFSFFFSNLARRRLIVPAAGFKLKHVFALANKWKFFFFLKRHLDKKKQQVKTFS